MQTTHQFRKSLQKFGFSLPLGEERGSKPIIQSPPLPRTAFFQYRPNTAIVTHETSQIKQRLLRNHIISLRFFDAYGRIDAFSRAGLTFWLKKLWLQRLQPCLKPERKRDEVLALVPPRAARDGRCYRRTVPNLRRQKVLCPRSRLRFQAQSLLQQVLSTPRLVLNLRPQQALCPRSPPRFSSAVNATPAPSAPLPAVVELAAPTSTETTTPRGRRTGPQRGVAAARESAKMDVALPDPLQHCFSNVARRDDQQLRGKGGKSPPVSGGSGLGMEGLRGALAPAAGRENDE